MMFPIQSRGVLIILISAIMLLGGCSKFSTEYGRSKGSSGRYSLNGFAALRNTYAGAGFKTRDISRLSERVAQTDTIVWTPQVLSPIGNDVTRWFDRWLCRGDRTLVYIVPDSGSEGDYWIDARKLAPPEQRLEYRKRVAESINRRMLWRLNRDAVQSNGWFRVEPITQRTQLGDVKGAWEIDVCDEANQRIDSATEFRLTRYDPDAPNPAGNTGVVSGATGPSSQGWRYYESTSATKTPINFRPLLVSESGAPVVAEITSERWKDSRIIVVAGGSMLTNYAFTRPFNRKLANEIVRASTPPGDRDLSAGFMTSSWQPIPVSKRKQGVPEASGMELLTVWPLSIVTTHGVMLGLVICLMLWPIFGRPRRVKQSHQSDFGDHLDAVAALMNRAGGEAYARARISEYMRRMHQETSGPWVLPDQHSTRPAAVIAAARAKPLAEPAGLPASDPGSTVAGATAIEKPAEAARQPAALKTEVGIPERAIPQRGRDAEVPMPVDQRAPLLETCDQILERRMREITAQEPQRSKTGVSIPRLELVRSAAKLTRLSESSVLCVLVIDAKLSGHETTNVAIREFVSGAGSNEEQAIRKSVGNYMDVAFPPILALVDSDVAAATATEPAGQDRGWEVFTGKRLIEGDQDGWLSGRLGDASVLSLWGQSLSDIFSRPGIHSCSLSADLTAQQSLHLECYIDGHRSPQAEQQVRLELSKLGPLGGVWRLRQFFTMRPNRQVQ